MDAIYESGNQAAHRQSFQRRVTINIPQTDPTNAPVSPSNSSGQQHRGWSILRKVSVGSASRGGGGSISTVGSGGGGSNGGGPMTLLQATERLRDAMHNGSFTDNGRGSITAAAWDSVAAAAAVVAASASPHPNRPQFGVGDRVLCLLKLLNVTAATSQAAADYGDQYGSNRERFVDEDGDYDDDDARPWLARQQIQSPFDDMLVTTDPVNKYGYPAGEGFTDEERRGPYSYVLCTVERVNFEEDERYYTVCRADTKTSQRAESAWMEPIAKKGPALEAAERAASRNRKALENPLSADFAALRVFYQLHRPNRYIAIWRNYRARTKLFLNNLLHGNSGFACRFNISGINFLVLAHILYLFVDVMTLAFLPASCDHGMAILGLYVTPLLQCCLPLAQR
jgi:hypothetical protein